MESVVVFKILEKDYDLPTNIGESWSVIFWINIFLYQGWYIQKIQVLELTRLFDFYELFVACWKAILMSMKAHQIVFVVRLNENIPRQQYYFLNQ